MTKILHISLFSLETWSCDRTFLLFATFTTYQVYLNENIPRDLMFC